MPLAPGRPAATIDDQCLAVRMGLLGRADIPLERIASVGRLWWPWWAGLGVRIARGLVAYVGASGPAVVVDLTEPVSVRAPLGWRARRVAIGVEDVDGLVRAIAEARGIPVSPPEEPGEARPG